MQKRFSSLFSSQYFNKINLVSIISHRLSDVDAYCSSIALSEFLKNLNPNLDIEISAFQGYNIPGKKIQEEFKHKTVEKPCFNKSDIIFILDTGNASQLGCWVDDIKNSNSRKVSIDHHPSSSSMLNIVDDSITFEELSSTSEIIFNLFKHKNLNPSEKISQAILLGIQFDTQSLKLAKVSTLENIIELVHLGASLEYLSLIFNQKRDRSEIIARLKSAQRLKLFTDGNWIIGITTIKSFQSSAAQSIIDLGADIGVALSVINSEIRISFRSTSYFYNTTKIHLGKDISSKLASSFNGEGGGHKGAASLSCQGDVDIITSNILDLFATTINCKLFELK